MTIRKMNMLNGIKVDREKLSTARRAKGLTQRALAEAIGKSGHHIVSIEIGRKQPSPHALAAICAVLGVEESEITETVPE